MNFLIDGDLPGDAAQLARFHGHEAVLLEDIGLLGADDAAVAAAAIERQLCLVTADFDFADIRNYPPERHCGIVVLVVPYGAKRAYILGLLESYLRQPEMLTSTVGRLAIVEFGRIRFRPALD